MKKEDTRRIVIEENARYSESLYNTEKELETLAFKNKYALFGESTIYFDKKMLITSIAKLSKIPDGLFLAVNNHNDAKLWIVEYELSSHDLHSHIFLRIRTSSKERIYQENYQGIYIHHVLHSRGAREKR